MTDPKPSPRLTPEQAEQIRTARLGAAIRKVKAGKSLTLGEQRLIDSMTVPERTEQASWPSWCSSIAQASALTGVSKQALRTAKAQGCPAFRHSRVNPREAVAWIEAKREAKPEAAKEGSPPVRRTLAQEIDDLTILMAQADASAMRLQAAGDNDAACAEVEKTKTLMLRRESAFKELRRQGRTEEDAIGRADVERIAHALALQSCHALQRIAREAVGKLIGLTDPADILAALEGQLIPAAFIAPFRQATQVEAGHGLPAWVADAMERASKELVE